MFKRIKKIFKGNQNQKKQNKSDTVERGVMCEHFTTCVKEFGCKHVDRCTPLFRYEELGITGHEDLGLKDGMYCDIIHLGPLHIRIEIGKELCDSAKSPAMFRMKELEIAIKDWHVALKTSNPTYT